MITTIDKVVRAAIVENGYKTLRNYVLYLHFAFDALYKLKRDNVILNVNYLTLTVTNRRVTVPPNVLGISGIGLSKGARIIPFMPDQSLSLDPSATPVTSSVMAGDNVIPYRYDVAAGEIIFERAPASNVVYLEVVESGINPTTETVVPGEAVLPMKSYISFRHARFKLGASSAEARAAELEYMDELDEAIASQSDITASSVVYALNTAANRRWGMPEVEQVITPIN